MAEKTLNNIRIVNKHDTEANWKKATGFIPKQGELIVYDKDSTYNYERFKIGDGSTLVSSLPFADANKVDKVSGKGLSTNDYTTAEKNKLAGIAEGANKIIVDSVLSTSSTNPVQNKVVNTAISNLNTLVGDTKVSTQITNAIVNKSDIGHTHDDRYYTESEVDSKLSGKSDSGHTHSAYVNQNAFSKITVGSTTIEADNSTDTLTLVAGSNVTLTPDASGDKVTIAATNTVYTHPTYTAKNSGLYKITVDGTGHVSGATAVAKSDITGLGIPAQDTTYSAATQSTAGLMSAADKKTLDDLDAYVGDKKVSEQITEAIAGKSDTGHTHNYAGSSSAGGAANSVKANLAVKLNGGSTEGTNLFTYNGSTAKTVNITPSAIGAAASSHGNHVPATETANNAKFLRNDNTWQTVTPANIGAAASNHGTHVSYSTTAPVMDGTASVGSASTVARSDHKHPTDTSRASASDFAALKGLVGDTKVSDQIASAINTATVTWDKVSGKPFNTGDITIDWDGNTTGKTYVATNGETYYKVSNYIFSTCDFTNDNAYLAVIDAALNTPITERIPLSNVVEEDGVLVIGSYNIISTPYDSMELYINGSFVTFPTAGTYFRYIPEAFYVSSLYVQQASGKIYSKSLPQGVASKAELAQQARNSTWTQIYNSGATTKNVNAFSNIDISGYTKIKVAIKCVNVTASAGATSGAVIFTDEFGSDYSFSSLFGNLITNTTGTAAAMAEFTVVDGFIICDNALRSTSATNMLSNTDGQGAWNLTSVGGGLITCNSTLATMKIATTNLSTTHYYGTGSKVIVWGCKA